MLMIYAGQLSLDMKKPINEILEKFVVKKVEETKFRFCGNDIEQMPDMSIKVTCVDAIETLRGRPITTRRKPR